MAVLINRARIITMARINMQIQNDSRAGSKDAEFEGLLAEALRRKGWRIIREPRLGNVQPDLVFDQGDRVFIAELKRSSEGRRDRLIPLISQAILQARAFAQNYPGRVVPVAIVAAPRVSASVADEIKRFSVEHAPDVAVGVMDAEGFRAFWGHGLEQLNSARRSSPSRASSLRPLARLFSDLNQWMLKVLLSEHIPESLLSAPRGPYRNASQLAQAADVSIMSAFRFLREMSREGFIEEQDGLLRVVRMEPLLERWAAANQRAGAEYPARWILPSGQNQLYSAVRAYASRANSAVKPKARRSQVSRSSARLCIGLFAAAELLERGFVQGIPPHLYVERADAEVLRELGLSLQDAEHRADVYVRIPECDESVFRAAVKRDGIPVADIVQVWLDVSNFPARGKAQADEIRRGILRPMIKGGQ
jgi:Holliday junction resolvase